MATKKLRVLFDAEAMVGPKTGVGYYTANLVKALAEQGGERIELWGHYFNFLARHIVDLPHAPHLHYSVSRLLPRQLVNVLRRYGVPLPFEFLVRRKGDFILYPSFLSRPSLFRTPSASVVHDLTYLEHPNYVNQRSQKDLEKLMPATLRRSRFVITVSRASCQALHRYYPWFKRPIVVEHIPPVLERVAESVMRTTLAEFGIVQPYILFVGTLEPRKNINGLLSAYMALPEKIRSTHALVLVGGRGWRDQSIHSQLDELRAAGENIIVTGYVTPSQRTALTAQAAVFVLVSFYEGYGMPLLEAASLQVPIVASDIAVFHEVIGQGALYAPPDEPGEIAQQIQHALAHQRTRRSLVAAQKKLVSELNWADVAAAVLAQIEKTIQKGTV